MQMRLTYREKIIDDINEGELKRLHNKACYSTSGPSSVRVAMERTTCYVRNNRSSIRVRGCRMRSPCVMNINVTAREKGGSKDDYNKRRFFRSHFFLSCCQKQRLDWNEVRVYM